MINWLAPAFALLAGVSGASSQSPIKTTLCEVVQHPSAFDGKVIRFRAGVFSDFHHGTVLIHSGCPKGIELTSTDKVEPEQTASLDRAVGTPMSGGFDRIAMVTFTGRSTRRIGQPQSALDSPFKFDAYRVENIRTYPRRRRP